MSVDDHGLEAIRKSANEKISGNRNNYYLSTVDWSASANSLSVEKTTVTTSATKITLPSSGNFILFHQTEDGVLYISDNSSVDNTTFKIREGDYIKFKDAGAIDLYGLSASGNIIVFCIALERV